DWLKSNLARIGRLMQGHRDLIEVAKLIMSELTPLVSAQYGAFYGVDSAAHNDLVLIAGYGVRADAGPRTSFRMGEGIVGQAALEGKHIVLDPVPPGAITIDSGLSSATPAQIVVLPILFESKVLGVLELASLTKF